MAEEHFPLRILIRMPSGGFNTHGEVITEWLDRNCGVDRWSISRSETRSDDAIAVHLTNPSCALAFLDRWCLADDPSGLYDLRRTDP
jgi:hypothetical protein